MKIKQIVFLITYVIGFIGFLSVARFVDYLYDIAFLTLFIIGAYSDYKNKYPVPRIVLNILSLMVVIFMATRISADNIVIPSIETLLILLGIKFLENKEFRDFMQIYMISVFLLAGSALLTIDISFMLFFILLFFLVVIGAILLTYYTQDRELVIEKAVFKRLLVRLTIIPVVAIPFTILLFIILPRSQYPVFNFLNSQSAGRTGFSDSVQLGDVSQIQEDNTIIMRLKTDQPLDRENTYFRGIVLNFFDGHRWYRRFLNSKEEVSGKVIKQEIILEPYGNRYIFAIDVPVKFNRPVRRYNDFTFMSYRRIFNRIKYTALSVVTKRIKVTQIDKRGYLQYPKNINPKIIRLAKQLKGRTEIETVRNVIGYLKKYKYSLKNLKKGKDPLYDFLFVSKAGNCEYFASAAAVLLRIDGIPTRLVAGYRGVRYNEPGNFYYVPQSFAHTWVESYINGYWYRLDPTPSYSAKILEKEEKSVIMEKVRAFWEAVEYAYINMVINFDFSKQMKLIRKTSSIAKNFRNTLSIDKYLIIKLVILASIMYLIFYFVRHKSTLFLPPEKRLLNAFLKKMEKYGYKKGINEGLEEFVNRIDDAELKQKAYKFVFLYQNIYYRDKQFTPEEIKHLKDIVRDI